MESLEGRRLLSYGVPKPAFQVNQAAPGGQSEPRTIVNERRQVAVVWEDFSTDGSGYGVYARRFDSSGVPLGDQFRVNTATVGDQTDPRIAVRYSSYRDSGLIATWRDGGQVYFQRYDAQGAAVGTAAPLAGTAGVGADYELVSLPTGGFLIVAAAGAFGYDSEGAPTASSAAGASHAGWTAQAPDAGHAGIMYFDQTLTTWAETRSRDVSGTTVYDARIWAQALDSSGQPSGPELLIASIDGAASADEVADLDPVVVRPRGYYGSPLVAWRQAGAGAVTFHARRLDQDFDGVPTLDGDPFELTPPTAADSASFSWLDDGSLLAFFIREDSGGPDGGYFQAYSTYDGTAQGGPVEAPAVSAESLATLSVVSTVGSDFWLVWGDPQADPAAGEIQAQRHFSTEAALHLAVDDLDVQESVGQAVVVIIRSGDLSQPASLAFATRADGSARPVHDYVSTSGVLNFAPGQAEGTISIAIVDDSIAENYEYFAIHLSDPVGASFDGDEAYVSIEDDEAASSYTPVFVDYGAAGLWTYNPIEGWAQVSASDPEAVVSTYRRDAYIDFGPGGLWHWDPQAGWSKLNDVNPQAIKLDEATGGLYIDFGAAGLWRWTPEGGYSQINAVDPQNFLVSYNGLTIDFGGGGLWNWSTFAGWSKLNDLSPEAMVGDGSDRLYLDFGAGGLWSWDDSAWTKISDSNPEGMKIGYDIVGGTDYEDVLYLDFGQGGFWKWGQTSGWSLISPHDPESFIDDGYRTLYIDFGGGGLWQWSAAGGYRSLNATNPELVAFSTIDDNLYIDFGAGGFWRWTAVGGYTRLNGASPEAISQYS